MAQPCAPIIIPWVLPSRLLFYHEDGDTFPPFIFNITTPPRMSTTPPAPAAMPIMRPVLLLLSEPDEAVVETVAVGADTTVIPRTEEAEVASPKLAAIELLTKPAWAVEVVVMSKSMFTLAAVMRTETALNATPTEFAIFCRRLVCCVVP